MKVVLVNGSPNEHGCTYTALSEVKKAMADSAVARPDREERVFTNFIRERKGCLFRLPSV